MSCISSTAKAKSWENGPLWIHFKVYSASSSSSTSIQLNLQQTFVKAKAITCAIGMMVAVDLKPYTIVENEGFKELLRILEPQYLIISRKELTETVVLDIHIRDYPLELLSVESPTPTYQALHFGHWSTKIAWIRAIVNRAYRICSNATLLNNELKQIQNFLS